MSNKNFLSKRYIFIVIVGVIIIGINKNSTIVTSHDIENTKEYTPKKTTDMKNFQSDTDDFITQHTRYIHKGTEKEEHEAVLYQYQCDGRQYCSQMHSCKEATYFLQHCPDTHMDGDRDGIPCERQWCGH